MIRSPVTYSYPLPVLMALVMLVACSRQGVRHQAARARAAAELRATSQSFFSSLDQDDSEINASGATLDDPFWRVYLDVPDTAALQDLVEAYTSGEDPPDIAPFLARPLVIDGQEVVETSNKRARQRIAVAACKDGKPIIYWSPYLGSEVSPYSLVFFRLHEAAHFRLRHVVCGGSPGAAADYPTSPAQEQSADCSARSTLAASETGQEIIGSAYERLWSMKRPGDGRYPSSRSRATTLRNKCIGMN
jgi:hypothetical protein